MRRQVTAMWCAGFLAAVGSLVGPSAAWAQVFGNPSPERYFRVEWEPSADVARGPAVTGYVYNDYAYTADNVRLLVEGLDSGGNVVSTTIGYVLGTVSVGSRRYFTVEVPRTGLKYRVSVLSWDWVGRGV